MVLEHVAFIVNTNSEIHVTQELSINLRLGNRVGSDDNVDLITSFLDLLTDKSTLVETSIVGHDVQDWTELLELAKPVLDGGRWDDNQVRPLDALLEQMCEESNDLASLAQAHVIGENAAEFLFKQQCQPVDTHNLVIFHHQVVGHDSGLRDKTRFALGNNQFSAFFVTFGRLAFRRRSSNARVVF